MRLDACMGIFLRRVMLVIMGSMMASLGANERGTVPVGMEEFIGGTAEVVAQLVRADLDSSGVLDVRPGLSAVGSGWLLRASSSAGRIDGALLDRKGNVVFNNHYDEPDLRDNAHSYADDVVTSITQGRGIASTKIAFVSRRSGHPEIYLADSDGERIQQVTNDRFLKGAPSLGPGSILLAYTSWQSGYADVVLKDLRFGVERAVLNAPGTNSGAAFSRDGTRLALTMSFEGDTEVYVTTLTGSNPVRLSHSRSVEFSPCWSPDGERVAFCSDAGGSPQLFVVPRTGGSPARIVTGYRHTTSPEWSPDGALLAFTGRQSSGPAVILHDLPSGRDRVLLPKAEDPTWAPNGRHLAAIQGGNLVVVDIVSGRRRVIVSGFAGISEPSWSR